MTILNILQYPDSRLRRKGVPVTDFGPTTQKVIDDMFETHYAADNCAALAATQLDLDNAPHITVIDFSPQRDQPMCLVNAEIVNTSENKASGAEGCMSVGVTSGGITASVTRPESITVKAQDRYGKELNFDADGFLAKCIQHELDHLKGVLFIDHLSALKRSRVTKQLKHKKV